MSSPYQRQDAILAEVAERFGGEVPNVFGTLAQHPAALAAFVRTESALRDSGYLSRSEQNLVALEGAVANNLLGTRIDPEFR